MKNLFLLIFLITLFSCKNHNELIKTYANEIEKNIIDEMFCWTNYQSENIWNEIIYSNDEEEKKQLFNKMYELNRLAEKNGRERIKNDTVFINIIRNDSLLKELTNQRNQLAKEILVFHKKVPFFDEYIDKISKDIIEYKYLYIDEFGLYEYQPRKTGEYYSNDKTFFKNYTELLKESYKLLENSKIKEEYVIELNKYLISIEKIDRKLWLVKYYFEAEQKLETKKLENEREKKIDSLLKQ